MDELLELLKGAGGQTAVLAAFLLYLVRVLIPGLEKRNETARQEFLTALEKQEQAHVSATEKTAQAFKEALDRIELRRAA